jgi:crossover junction endodeoxyribonuclease RuvC
MVILGVDPGYATIGCGVLRYQNDRFCPLDCRAVTTPAGMPFEQRLLVIHREMSELIERFSPDAMAVEELFFGHNQTTGIYVAQARGVILLAAAQQGVEPFEYTPMQVKQAVVGYGNAEKRQVMDMTRRILGLGALPRPDDIADALAVAICHGHSVGAGALGRALQTARSRRGR